MGFIGNIQSGLILVLALVGLVLEVWALIHAATTRPRGFAAAGKRTKTFWVVLLAVALVIGFLGIPPPLGIGGSFFFIIGAAIPAGIYLADVRPAVTAYGGRGRRGPGRGGGRGSSGPSGPYSDDSWRQW